MIRITGMSAVRRWRAWAVPCLLTMGVAACGGGNETIGVPETQLAAKTSTATPSISVRAASTTYSVINLTSDGYVSPQGINATGQVAFYGSTPDGNRAFFYDGVTIQELGTLGGRDAFAGALNGSGQVVGAARTANGNLHAFSWTPTGGMVDLGTFGGDYSSATAVNDSGQVAGNFNLSSGGAQHAFSWTHMGGKLDLGTLGGPDSVAILLNDAGQVAGNAGTANGDDHAFSWTAAGGMVDLGTLGGRLSYAGAINDTGQVVGDALTASSNNYHAFSWTATGGMLDLGTLDGAYSRAEAVNHAGQVAGVAETTHGYHAFSWTAAGGMIDLSTLGGQFSDAFAINRAGQVVGNAFTSSNYFSHAYVWTQSEGMVDLNTRISTAPAGLELFDALAISDNGSIVANSNAGIVLLKPGPTSAAAPAVGPISANDPVASGIPVSVSASFTDADAADTHTATWSWGDGSNAEAGTVAENNGVGHVGGTHTYDAAGVYAVAVSVTDNTGLTSKVRRDVVVYDPSAGFVTGAGSIMSPPGAFRTAPTVVGRATFGFVSKYRKGATVPTGKTEFQFHAANLSFHSQDYDWLVVAGARAQYKGCGTINGAGDYEFILTAVDGAVAGGGRKDRFRIKIWHHDAGTNADVVDYDNQIDTTAEGTVREGTVIHGGRIVIHK